MPMKSRWPRPLKEGGKSDLLSLCEFRADGLGYVHILEYYLHILGKDSDHGYLKPSISILEKEAYLRICPDERLRNLYLKCM